MLQVHSTPTEIAAPPERVREVFLDFAKLPEWHQTHFKSIEVPSGKNPKDLVAGDKLKIAMQGMKFSPTILENTPAALKWRGSLPYIFTGEHVFEFQPSKISQGSTTFVQYETFTGLLSSLGGSGSKTSDGFDALNKDLKKRVEDSA